MHVAITGSSGLVGTALRAALLERGDSYVRLVRHAPRAEDEVQWSPSEGEVDDSGLTGVDAVIHLAGENIAGGRWNSERKRRIRQSRVNGTEAIAAAVARLPQRPALVSASAVGYYGDRGDEVLVEDSAPGDDFLSEVCVAWEASADAAREAGARVVHPRLGMVLDGDGGALAKMLPAFKLGGGGPLGPGTQWVSWIAIDDLVRLLIASAEDAAYEGPINAVAPGVLRQKDFAKTLGDALNRPAIVPAPRFALRAALGEMADALLLVSQRVSPAATTAAGFTFETPRLEGALARVLS